jgi:hypothetical protein
MPRDTTPKSIAAKAERDAIELLRARTEGIGEASVLRHRLDQLADELSGVAEQYAAALAKLRNNGWTDDELTKLGLTDVPTGHNGGRRRPARQYGVPTPRIAGPASPARPAGAAATPQQDGFSA